MKVYHRRNLFLAFRKIKEKIFRFFGFISIVFAIFMLGILLYSIFSKGYSALKTYYIEVTISWDSNILESITDANNNIDFAKLLDLSFKNELIKSGYNNPKNTGFNVFSPYEYIKLKQILNENPDIIGTQTKLSLLANSTINMYYKGYLQESSTMIGSEISELLNFMKSKKISKPKFNVPFFTNPDSRYPELAGIKGAFFGSLYTITLTLLFSVVVSVGTAVYLEEFAKKSKLVSFIEVNINNLAAVPSIIFGLLGLVVFQQFLGVPRSTPLLAALILTLMSLPTIIITTRIAISSVPESIKEAAYGIGSSKIQVITRHILPISLPGILTGTIIAISRTIGETAPLLMIGMVAFISSVPTSATSQSTVLPIQILLWFNSPEVGFVEKASLTIMLLLVVLILINYLAIYLRKKFEVKF